MQPPATSVLLQGGTSSSDQILFLFPDGSGTAVPFTTLPQVSPRLKIYGLNCPFARCPEKFNCGVQDLTPSYVAEIQRRQPEGPYNLGGWSAGGICALDAAQALHQQGESVEHLILLDSPCPVALQPLPSRLLGYLKGIGVFNWDGQAPPDRVFRHFDAFLMALRKYKPKPCQPYQEPQAHLLWAGIGVCEGMETEKKFHIQSGDAREVSWMLYQRQTLEPMGWDRLLSEHAMDIEVLESAHHFNMFRGENAALVADFLRRSLKVAV